MNESRICFSEKEQPRLAARRTSLHRNILHRRFETLVFCMIFFIAFGAEMRSATMGADTLSTSELKKISLEDLMNIEVTSVSKSPEKLSETPSAIQVITADEIRRSGASSIPEALRLATNLDVAQKNSHDWAISARGFNTDLSNKLLVMIDGRTVYSPLYSGVFWDAQDYELQDIDRIEVISGPGGTLWGANAVNGVINIITKSAKETQGWFVSAGGGSELQDFADVRYGGILAPNVFFRAYGKYFNRGDEVAANGDDTSDSWKKGQGGFRIDAASSPNNNITLQGDYYSGTENQETGGNGKVSGGNVLSRWTHTISSESDIKVQLYYDHTYLLSPKPAAKPLPAGNLTDGLDTYDVDFQHRFPLGGINRIIWGFGYRRTHDVVGNSPTVVFTPSVLNQNLYNGFLQDELTLQEDLFFTLGSKIEHNDYTGYEYEPNARLQWNFLDQHTLWTAVSRAVRTPSRIDHDFSSPTGLPAPYSYLYDAGTNFISETVIAYEAGYRFQIGSEASVSLSAFYNDYKNVRSLTPTPTTPILPIPLIFNNNLEGFTKGFELNANVQALDWWLLRGGYDLLIERIHVKSGSSDFTNGLNETADPQQQFSIHSSMDLLHNIELDLIPRWVDELHVNNGPTPGIVASYFELNLQLGWRPGKRFEISLVGENLLHPRHPEYGYPGLGREEIVRSGYGQISYSL
ncbi:MAG TPA: TonB-dependent receptor [Bacteroidota bacterium]|nr:TonB-dependent receptor [Bacteroidota bacterium]